MAVDDLIFPTIVSLVCSLIIFFGNINIILATIRNKSLQHPCNYLIAFNALSETVSQFTYFILSFYLFSGNPYTTRLTCLYWQLLPTSAGIWGLVLTLAIGFDRLIGVVIPLKYHQLKTSSYVFILVFLSIIFTTWVSGTNFLYTLAAPNDTVVCFATSVSHPEFTVTRNITQSIICGLILSVYLITWLILKINKNDNKNMKQILKALTIIMLMVVFTWPLTIALVVLIRQFIPPEETLTVILYIVWITNFGKASNYFIFFAFSKDYRKAFLQQLSCVPYYGKFVHPQIFPSL